MQFLIELHYKTKQYCDQIHGIFLIKNLKLLGNLFKQNYKKQENKIKFNIYMKILSILKIINLR